MMLFLIEKGELMVQKIAPYFSKLKMDNGQLKII